MVSIPRPVDKRLQLNLFADDILSDKITEEGDALGLDHVDKTKGNIWRTEGGVFIK